MLPLENPKDLNILSKESEFSIPMQNYICKNIIRPLKDVITRPGHIKIERFIMETGLKDESYINLTAGLEQKNFISTNKNEIVFNKKKIDNNKDLYKETVLKGVAHLNEEEKEKTIQKIKTLYESSNTIEAKETLLHAIYTSSQNRQFTLLQADFQLKDNFNWNSSISEIKFNRILSEIFGLFSFYYSIKRRQDETDIGEYCKAVIVNFLQIFAEKVNTTDQNFKTKPEIKKISQLNSHQVLSLNKILSFAYFLPGKLFNEINYFYNNLDDSFKNYFRKQFDTFSYEIKAELP